MTDLLDLLKQRYLETLRSVQTRWKILVVDEESSAMLTSVLPIFEVLAEGVQQIDLITSQRSSQSNTAVLYLLMPTAKNVDLILSDFNPNPLNSVKSNKKTKDAPPPSSPKYSQAHVHFLDGIPDDLATKLTNGLAQDYLQALQELNVNFHALEPRAFTLKSPQSFFTLYAPPKRSPRESVEAWEEEIGWISRSIVNSLATLGEYPLIRYYNPPSSYHAPLGPALSTGEHLGKRLAFRVQEEIDAYARNNSAFPPIPDPPRPRGVLFITDRSMDLCAPLLHEFTYQAMCNDLLEVLDGQKYMYSFRNEQGVEEEKEALLTDTDPVWKEVRHMHMKDALDQLVAKFKAYAGEHSGKFGNEGKTSMNDMQDMLASLPQLKEVKEKLSLHLTMAEKCMALFEKKKLPLSASVEQCCATGQTPEGKSPKGLVEDMVPLLDDRGVSSTDKLRIIALYIMFREGVPEGDKTRLYQHARLALHEMDAVNNLTYLGVNVSNESSKKKKPLFKHRNQDDAYDISRYQPAVKYMLEDHFANKLDQVIFPYVRDAPVEVSTTSRTPSTSAPGSLRSAKPVWTTRGASKRVANEPRQRVIVFVAGGLTYSEIRVAYKVSEASNKDVFIGSTNIITPAQFVADLGSLDRGGGSASSALRHATTSYAAPTKQQMKQTEKDREKSARRQSIEGPPMNNSGDRDRRPSHAPPPQAPSASSNVFSRAKARNQEDPRSQQDRYYDQSRQQQPPQQQPPPSQYQERERYYDPPPAQLQQRQYDSSRNGYDSRPSYDNAPPPSTQRDDYARYERSAERYPQPSRNDFGENRYGDERGNNGRMDERRPAEREYGRDDRHGGGRGYGEDRYREERNGSNGNGNGNGNGPSRPSAPPILASAASSIREGSVGDTGSVNVKKKSFLSRFK